MKLRLQSLKEKGRKKTTLISPVSDSYCIHLHFRLYDSSVLYFSLNWAFVGPKHKLHVSTRVRQKVQTRRVVFLFVENRALIDIIILHRSSHLSIYLSIYPTIYLELSIYIIIYISIYLSTIYLLDLPFYLSIHRSMLELSIFYLIIKKCAQF